MKRLAVYCGSSDDAPESYYAMARTLGSAMAERGIELVYGGGKVGLMGACADACLEAGGRVVGVIPEKLAAREVAHPGCTELFVVTGMHARKQMMISLADAYLALPGGFGTLEELSEVLTWKQIGYHSKPIGILNLGGYYDGLLQWVEHAAKVGFVRPQHRGLFAVIERVEDALSQLGF